MRGAAPLFAHLGSSTGERSGGYGHQPKSYPPLRGVSIAPGTTGLIPPRTGLRDLWSRHVIRLSEIESVFGYCEPGPAAGMRVALFRRGGVWTGSNRRRRRDRSTLPNRYRMASRGQLPRDPISGQSDLGRPKPIPRVSGAQFVRCLKLWEGNPN